MSTAEKTTTELFLENFLAEEQDRMTSACNLPGSSTSPAITNYILHIQTRVDLLAELLRLARA